MKRGEKKCLPFDRSFAWQSNSNRPSNCACSTGNVFNNLSAFIVRNDPSSFPRFTLQKSNATVRQESALSFKYFAQRRMNGDMSYPNDLRRKTVKLFNEIHLCSDCEKKNHFLFMCNVLDGGASVQQICMMYMDMVFWSMV